MLKTKLFPHTTLSRHSVWTKFFLVTVIAFSASCKKESDIGLNVQPAGEVIDLRTTDTVSVFAHTVREDSLRSDEATIVQIGSYVDPLFGKVSAGLFTQVSIPNSLTNIDFGAGAVMDSATLQLSYDIDFYGDTTSQQIFNVYQVTQDMYKDSIYYSNHEKQYYPVAVGSTGLFRPHPRTRCAQLTDTVPPYLRIPIQNSFAQQLFAQSGGPNMANNAAFVNYFKGFYIRPETPGQNSGDGSILRFTPYDSLTRFTFYYHTPTDTLKFTFVLNSTTAFYNYFTHDYSGATSDLVAQINNPNATSNPYNEVYVQACSGVKTKIEFPHLNDLKNLGYKIAINKAELIIKADPSTVSTIPAYPLNTSLYLTYLDSAGVQYVLPDMGENSVYYGGSLITTSNEYHINIARYFQQLLNDKYGNYGLYLKELSPVVYARRAVLGSTNPSSPYKMYLHLVYTRIN